MRTVALKLFTFVELSEQAKERAINDWRDAGVEYNWADEWVNSLKAFCGAFGVEDLDYSVSPYSYSHVNGVLYQSQDLEGMSALRLRTWLINNWLPLLEQGKYYSRSTYLDGKYLYKSRRSKIQPEISCPFTGFCGDDSLIGPILDFVSKPHENETLQGIVDACLDAWMHDFIADMEYQHTDEYIAECLTCNEYEFTEDGKFY